MRATAVGMSSFDPVLGDPHLPDRFWRMVRVEGDCWLWIGSRNADGYGQVSWGGRSRLAHRVAFEAFLGPVPVGLVLDHFVCSNPPCCRPSHMHPTTIRGNVLRGDGLTARKARQTECRWGHPLLGDNLQVSGGKRVCRRCRVLRARFERARRLAGPPPIERRMPR